MKNQKLNLVDFKQNELSKEHISSVKAGESINPKPGATVPGSGSGETQGDVTCYFNFDHEVIYCINNRTGQIVEGFA